MSVYSGLPFAEQKKLKLKIEDIIPEYLDGEMRRTALGFVGYMRAHKMQPVWQSTNTWKANYKGQNICAIRLSEGSWRVEPRVSRWNKLIDSYNKYEMELTEDGLHDTVIANIYYCVSCANCGPGRDMDFFGKVYGNVCHNVPVRYIDPGEAEITCIKRILELMGKTFAEYELSRRMTGLHDAL